MLKYLSLILLLSCGCFSNKINTDDIINSYDCNSLKTNEKTFKIADIQSIKVYSDNKKTYIKFSDSWYVVHSDFIKTFNENQDYIINSLSNNNKRQKSDLKIIKYSILFLILTVIILLIYGSRTGKY